MILVWLVPWTTGEGGGGGASATGLSADAQLEEKGHTAISRAKPIRRLFKTVP